MDRERLKRIGSIAAIAAGTSVAGLSCDFLSPRSGEQQPEGKAVPTLDASQMIGELEATIEAMRNGAPVAAATPTAEATATAPPEATPTPTGVEIGETTVRNVPDRVDAAVVDVARGDFTNETDVAPHIFADPGGLLVGPDYESRATENNPFDPNPNGWGAMYESGGSIQPFSPVTQEVVRWSGEAFQNLPEGGFVFFSAGQMTVELPHPERDVAIVNMPHQPGHNWFFVARGLYPDGLQDSDRNTNVRITDYKPGHIELSMYQTRLETNTAFISEGQFLQKVATSHVYGTNCGAEGCSSLTVVAYDHNTGALEIWKHNQPTSDSWQEALQGARQNWSRAFSNWR